MTTLNSSPEVKKTREQLIDEAVVEFSKKLTAGFQSLNDVQAEVLAAAAYVSNPETAEKLSYGSEKVYWAHDGAWITLPGNEELPMSQENGVTISNFNAENFRQALLDDPLLTQ